MKKCAHPYPGDDSAHMRLATPDRTPADAHRTCRASWAKCAIPGKCRTAPPVWARREERF